MLHGIIIAMFSVIYDLTDLTLHFQIGFSAYIHLKDPHKCYDSQSLDST